MNASATPARALVVSVAFGGASADAASLEEICSLARSAGIDPVDRIAVRRPRPDAALSVGSGKAEEIRLRLHELQAQAVIFDNPLSSVQQRNLTRLLEVPVIDRTELILDIFAQRARSNEGKLQVELAQIEHQLSRLVRGWTHLERQRGGIGQRGGPGEKQIELDRRMLDTKARQLRQRLDKLERQRRTRRRARTRRDVFSVSLVGYTNAGKSTLFNALTGAGTYAADQLFATLDTLSRRVRVAEGADIVLSDTVGFVRQLPHSLIESFRATLEETCDADLLLHVVDASAPDRDDQIAEVQRVLDEIGAGAVPMLMVYNKIDAAGWSPEIARDPCGSIKRVMLSARTGEGLPGLRDALVESLAQTVQGGDPAVDPITEMSDDPEAQPETPFDPSHLDAATTDPVCGP
ncbi:MAG: GTPase HflX [Burkholderiaceae bacterium]|nr:GTPase HflX [Burkholderiaceae bacterium]